MEYKLIVEEMAPSRGVFGMGAHNGTAGFEAEVNAYLADGWICQGGVTVLVIGEKGAMLMQAVTK